MTYTPVDVYHTAFPFSRANPHPTSVSMPRDAKAQRRARRSLPSAIERNLSLQELLGGEDKRSSARRRRSLEKQQAELQHLNAYFAMIDETELKVEKLQELEITTVEEEQVDSGTTSDSELVQPRGDRASRTQTTVRRGEVVDKKLEGEDSGHCGGERAAEVSASVSIEEFADTTKLQAKTAVDLDESPDSNVS